MRKLTYGMWFLRLKQAVRINTQKMLVNEKSKPMATMGKYCKAYSLKKLRQFNQWTERAENSMKKIDAKEVEINRKLTDDDFLYLQENYVVTDGIFQDENIIFDNVTPEWREFCKNTLLFDIPASKSVEIKVLAS